MKRIVGAFCAAVLLLLLSGCQTKVDPQEVLADASQAMASAQSLQFAMQRQGEPKPLQLGLLTANLVAADGAYQAPDQIHAAVRLDMSGTVTEAEVLWLPDGSYVKMAPLFPDFTEFEIGAAMDAPAMFSSETGIPHILATLENPTLVGTEDLDGVQTHHINATANGEDLTGLTGVPVAAGGATVDIWVEQDTNQVVRLQVTESDGNGWLIDFFGYDEPVEMPAPTG